jgi:uncharacterized protein involved in outer membrane biogenesis
MKKILLAALVVIVVLVVGAAIAVRVVLGSDRVRRAVEEQASAALGRPVHVGAATAHIIPSVGLELHDMSIEGTTTALKSVSVETGLRGLFSRRVEDARIRVADSRIEVPWLLALMTSMARAPVPPAGSSPAFTIASVRAIELRAIELTAGKYLARVDADGTLEGDRLDVTRLSARAEGSALTASGEVTSLSRGTGTFTIDADTLDLDALIAFATAATPAGAPSATPVPPPAPAQAASFAFDVAVTAKSGRAATIPFTGLSSQIHATSASVLLRPISLRAFNGEFSGRMAMDTSGAVPQLLLTGNAKDVDAAAVSAFAGSPKAISGALSGRIAVACPCRDLASAMSHLTGDGNFAIVDGVIPGLQLVRTVVLAFGRPAEQAPPAGSGERFSRLAGSFQIAGGMVTTRDLTLTSRDFDLRGTGNIAVRRGTLAFDADVVLSPELSQQAGRDLYRYAREGDRVVVPAQISGTMSAPRVFIDLADAMKRAMKNELEQQGRSLLDRLFKRKKGGG